MTSPSETIAKALEGVTPGPWEVYDGCSWRRIGTVGRNYHDCAVLAPTVASDGHPDLTCAPGNDLHANLAYIAACSPDRMREVLDELYALRKTALQLEAMQREMAEKDERIAALEKGLKPFADEAAGWSDTYPDSCLARTSKSNLGDLRRARTLIQGEKP